MNPLRLAVIDLGSNTFHLLICEAGAGGRIAVIYKERIYVKLASGGLGYIDADCEARGVEAMQRFSEQIRAYGVARTRCIGTSALREARNGHEVARHFSSVSGLRIEIIDGQQEAVYIYKGIRAALPPMDRPVLIMDIGGGSVEFILYQGHQIQFKGSYKIGVAVLFRKFHDSDPITADAITALENFVEGELSELLQHMRQVPSYYLAGASGSFEVLNDVLPKLQEEEAWSELAIEGLMTYLDEIIGLDLTSRRTIPEIPIERLDYIVVAYALIRFIFRKIPPERLFFCAYSLKEGVLAEELGRNGE